MARETPIAAAVRWQRLEIVQEHYREFVPFLRDVMQELGFSATRIQEDIAEYLVTGPAYLMIQAQRGQAKTTVTAAFAVWSLIHNPSTRIMIISAGGKLANEISTLIVRIISYMDVLECMIPDKTNGDRTSTEAFDVHYSLKGLERSPSVRCEGIDANIQGARADLLIADDVESSKNSKTEHLREQLINLTRDFSSIVSTGRIVYLGTPQSENSIYNTLPGRGFAVRIWTGRYPTLKQEESYGQCLAPLLRLDMERDPSLRTGGGLLGDQGRPTDPDLPAGTEMKLQLKELDQGQAYFQLQHMLNTKLTDEQRYPLKTTKIMAVNVVGDLFPLRCRPSIIPGDTIAYNSTGKVYNFARMSAVSEDRDRLQSIVMAIDPAGGGKNGDETGYSVCGFLNGIVWVLEVGGIPGGFTEDRFLALAEIANKWKPNKILVEKNFGFGAWTALFLPVLRREYKRLDKPEAQGGCAVEEVFESGQKELRIIDTLEPMIGAGVLVFNADIMLGDDGSVQKYPAAQRASYSFLNQLTMITRDKNSLSHDDRLDSLATAVRHFAALLAVEQAKVIEQRRKEEIAKWQANPLGLPKHMLGGQRPSNSLFDRRRGR